MFDDPTFRDDVLQKRATVPLAQNGIVGVVCSWGKEILTFIVGGLAAGAISSPFYAPVKVDSNVLSGGADTPLKTSAGTAINLEDIENEIDLHLGLAALEETGSVPWKEVKARLQLP